VRVTALVVAMLLVSMPAFPQSESVPVANPVERTSDASVVDVPEALQRAFELMKQPGFHPELLEFFEADTPSEDASRVPAPAAMQTWEWIWIGIIIGMVVLVIFSVCSGQGSGISC